MIQRNVLIVDDEKSIREFISIILREEGYHTVTARTGKEALEKLKGGYFDIALVDIIMPDIGGVEVLQAIKERSPETVVVMITGFASVETAVESLKSGAFDYITKPFKIDYLRETLKKAIKNSGLNACPHITYVTDTNLRLIEANYAWDISAQAYGEEELLFENIKGRKILDFYQGVEKKKYGKIYRELLNGTRRVYWEEYGCGSGYETRFFEQKIYPLTVDENKTGLFFIHEDVTQSRRDEAEFRKMHQEIVEANLKMQRTMEMLRKSEERFRALTESTSDWIWEVDVNCIYTYTSPKVKELLGYEPEEIIGKTMFNTMTPEEAERAAVEFRNITESRRPFARLETTNQHKDGRLVVLEKSGVPIFDAAGNFQGYRGIDRDITERKRLEEELRKSEEKYRMIFENAREGISIYEELSDGSRKLVECNPQYAEMSGYSREELMRISDTQKIQMSHNTPQQEYVNTEKLLTGQPYSGIFSWIRPDGKENYIEYTAVRLNMEGSTFTIGIDHDITEHKQAEKALRESKELFEKIFISQRDAIFLLDARRPPVILNCNPAATDIFGYTRQEMLGRTTAFLHVDETELHKFQERLYPSIAERGFLHLPEFKMKRKDGTVFPTEHSVTPLEDEQGKCIGWVSVVSDITERKRMEAQLKASLKEKEVLLKEIHHRVKNNLQIICSLFNLQADSVEDERTLEIFNVSQNRVRTMALVHEYLYQSKDLARIDFAEYIQNLANYLFRSYQGDTDTIQLIVNIEDGISLDIDRAIPCGLILNELVSNALKYAFPAGARSHPFTKFTLENRDRKGEIRVDLRSDEDNECTFIVSDNGVGFPKELDFRNTESLGLQLVVILVEQIGGAIELDRSAGTRFKITFPKYKEGQNDGKSGNFGC